MLISWGSPDVDTVGLLPFISPLKKYVYIKYISIFMSLLFDMCKSIFKSRDNIFKKF